MASPGAFFAQAFESQCRAAIAKKLAETSALKKTLAGVYTVEDAQAKGFAPSEAQIREIAKAIRDTAEAAYGLPVFREMAAEVAAAQLVQAISPQVQALNAQWKAQKLFAFDAGDISAMMDEAHGMIMQAHTELA